MDLSAYALAVMLAIQPNSPYKESFEKSAKAVSSASIRSPIFAGSDGVAKTVDLVISVANFESGLQPDANGDCDQTTDKGICVKGSKPHSFCMMQINESNFKGYRTTREEILTNIDICVSIGISMMKQSFRICHDRPLDERLAWYAGGGNGCPTGLDAVRKSKHRIDKAMWLFKTYPVEN